MSEWITVKSEKRKKAPASESDGDARSGSTTGGGLASERAVFWGETTKKAAAKLEAYNKEQGRHGGAIIKDTDGPAPKMTGIPNAEAIGASFSCERFGKDENLLKKRLRLNLPFSEVDAVVRQIVNMLENDFRKATDCKWSKLVNGWLYLNKGASADKMPLGLISDDVARKELVETLHMIPKEMVPCILRDYLFPHFFRASLPDPKKKQVEGDAHLGAKIVIQIILQKWPGAIDQAFTSSDLPAEVVPFAGTILAPNLHHDKKSLAWVLKQLSLHTQDHCLALWSRIVDNCFSGKSVESDPLSPLQQVAHYLIGDKGCMRSFRNTSVPTLLSLYRIASHGSQDDTKQKISVLAASAAQNALSTFQVGDSRFNLASTIAMSQSKFGSALAAEPVMRLLAMALLSIGPESVPAVFPHVQDKNGLIAAVEATKHDRAAVVVQSLREFLSAHASQNAKISAKHVAATDRVVPEKPKASGGFGVKHVIVALTISAIGGYLCINNKCSGFCSNFQAICDAWSGRL